MRKGERENEKKSGVVTRGDIEDAEKNVDEMMKELKGNSNPIAKELLGELEIDKITLEALKDLEGNNDLKRETLNGVKLRREKFTSTLEEKINKLENAIQEFKLKLEKVNDKDAKRLLDELQNFSRKVKEMKEKKLDALSIKNLEDQFNIPRSRMESFLKKNSDTEFSNIAAQKNYDAKITVIEYYLKSIRDTYQNQKLAASDPKMIAYNKLVENFNKLKKDHKSGDSLEKFEALEEVLKIVMQDIRSPGVLKPSSKNAGNVSSEAVSNKKTPLELSDDARLAFQSLTTMFNTKQIVIDKDSLQLLRKINQIRSSVEANSASPSGKNTSEKQEPTGDFKTALRELKELEDRVIKARKAVLLFKKVAQFKVLKQMEKIVKDKKGVFENAMSSREAPISPPVPHRRNT